MAAGQDPGPDADTGHPQGHHRLRQEPHRRSLLLTEDAPRYLSEAAAPEASSVLLPGPWTHREVAANGQRFHVAECGDPGNPLVLLLHGFPEFWWSWRHQLVALADAGYHAVAADLRGYGASDKPPEGYDGPTLTADVTGLIRALGGAPAIVVGHDWGGALAWCAAALSPEAVRGIVAVSVPHPLRFRAAVAAGRSGQARMSSYMARFQVPRADDWLLDNNAGEVSELLHRWGGVGFPDPETDRRCREAIAIPGVAHSALEYYRWTVRAQLRPSGQRFMFSMRHPIEGRVLHLHGETDGCMLPASAAGSGRWVTGDYRWHVIPGVGHFPHEENPAEVTRLILEWLSEA